MLYAARDLHSHNPVGSLLQLRSALLKIQDPKPAESPADKDVIQIAAVEWDCNEKRRSPLLGISSRTIFPAVRGFLCGEWRGFFHRAIGRFLLMEFLFSELEWV